MKKYITYTMAAFFATTLVAMAAPPDKDAMMTKEKAAWQAFKDKKADDFKKVISANFVGVYSDGVQNMQQEMDSMKKWDMKSFTISDYNMVMTNADTAITTYKVKLEGTMGGKDASGNYLCGSVWQMKNGEWQAAFHTNIKEEPAAAPAAK